MGLTVGLYVVMQNFIAIAGTVAGTRRFIDILNDSRPSYWICNTRAWDHQRRLLKSTWWSLSPCNKFRYDRQCILKIMQVVTLCEFVLKMHIRTPPEGVLVTKISENRNSLKLYSLEAQ